MGPVHDRITFVDIHECLLSKSVGKNKNASLTKGLAPNLSIWDIDDIIPYFHELHYATCLLTTDCNYCRTQRTHFSRRSTVSTIQPASIQEIDSTYVPCF